MIKLTKRPLPEGVVIKQESDYRGGVVFKMLTEDCHDKCYICEDSVHTSPNVEHRIPHKGDRALMLCWDNMLLACSHCNNIKGEGYIGMLNPLETDPEQFIELSMDVDEELREHVVVRAGGKAGMHVQIIG